MAEMNSLFKMYEGLPNRSNALVGESVKILSIDGGGVRGVLTLQYLIAIEQLTGKPIQDLFDMFIGTSTGGIIVAALNVKDSNGNPKYTAEDVLNLYCNLSKTLFADNHKTGLFRPKFKNADKLEVLANAFGNVKLSEIEKTILLTTVDLYTDLPFLFSNEKAKASSALDFNLKDAVNATSDAVPYFDSTCATSLGNDPTTNKPLKIKGVDGGLSANNPEVIAFLAAQKMYPGAPVSMLSLGTGTSMINDTGNTQSWGFFQWLTKGKLISMLQNAVSSQASQNIKMLAESTPQSFSHYLRVQPVFDTAGKDTFNYSAIPDLINIGRESLAQNCQDLVGFLNGIRPEEQITQTNCLAGLNEPDICTKIPKKGILGSIWGSIFAS
ncbi:MAG: hypothetical protein S4CHLAM102_12560 [Chlamydiia bacterium]|nr:hypothetical protein [Chlamydiia bacterium]